MATQSTEIKLQIKNARISFPALFTPDEMTDDNGKKVKKYGCHLLIHKDDPQVKEIQRAMRQASIARYGANGGEIFKDLWGEGRVCMRKGEKKKTESGEVMDGYADHYFISCSSKSRPTVIGRDRVPLDESDGRPYSGCFVNAIVAIWAQKPGKYGKRVNCQLQGVQFVKDGDAFGGGRVANADEFDALEAEFADGDDSDDFGDLS